MIESRSIILKSFLDLSEHRNRIKIRFGLKNFLPKDLLIFFDSGTTVDQFEKICRLIQPTPDSKFTFASERVFKDCAVSSDFLNYVTDNNYDIIGALNDKIDHLAFSKASYISNALCGIIDTNYFDGNEYKIERFLNAIRYGFSDRFAAKLKKFYEIGAINNYGKKLLVFCSDIELHHYAVESLLRKEKFSRCIFPTYVYQRSVNVGRGFDENFFFDDAAITLSYRKISDASVVAAKEFLHKKIPIFFSNLADQQYAETLIALADDGRKRRKMNIISPVGIHAQLKDAYALKSKLMQTVCISDYQETGLINHDDVVHVKHILGKFHEWLKENSEFNSSADITIKKYLFEFTKQVFVPTLYGALAYVKYFELISKAIQPTAFIVCSGRSMESRLGVEVFKAQHTPTLDVQAGTISLSNRFRAPTADFVMCMDQTHRTIYEDGFGVPAAQLAVIGSPRIDWKLRGARLLDKVQCRRILFPEFQGRTLTVLATQPIEWGKRAKIASLCIEASDKNNILAIKLHPSEGQHDLHFYRKLAKDLGKSHCVSVHIGMDTYRLIVAADFVATYFSTIAIEAFALGRRVLIVDPFEVEPALNFYKSGIGEKLNNCHDLRVILDEFDANQPASRDHVESRDGRSSHRFWKHADRISGSSSRYGFALPMPINLLRWPSFLAR